MFTVEHMLPRGDGFAHCLNDYGTCDCGPKMALNSLPPVDQGDGTAVVEFDSVVYWHHQMAAR